MARTEVRRDRAGRPYGYSARDGRIPVKEANRRIAISRFARRRERVGEGTFKPVPVWDIEVELRETGT